jgi:hypothetical protein
MNPAQMEYLQGFNEELQELSVHRYITRNSGLQQEACSKLEEILKAVSSDKAKSIAERDGHFANVLLGCEALLLAYIAEIKMYLLLKEDKPDAAWTELVKAQDGFEAALRADDGFGEDVARQLRRLQGMEKLLFPPQSFLSTGWIVKDEICSICSTDYEDCEHIKGRPYMGQFCVVHIRSLEVNHVAIVDKPASKHCRITHKTVSGGRENRMSLLVEPELTGSEDNATVESEGKTFHGILATTSSCSEVS